MKTDKDALQWEKVHVFISSTFNDMHAERDYLVKRVFPELQDWCERRKLRLVDIDLRWGVTEQDATHNKNVVKVCLSRIDDCRPFFLCFLGQRRGWVPKENEVSPETFDSFPDLRPVVGAASVTEMEILHALINPFHQSLAGKSEKPAEYYERAKYAFFYLRDPSYLDQLPNEPSMLRETYTNEWVEDAAERQRHDSALKKWREQEIPKSNRPFHLYEAKWGPNETTPELMIPLQCPSADFANIKRWQRQWQQAGVTVTGLNLTDDQVEANRAGEFNARLTTGRLSNFEWEDAPLSKIIIKELQEAIAERFHNHSEIADESELQKEIDQQEQFLFAASEGFIQREGDFAELDEYVESDSKQLFVLTAAGGMGKSTLLANWVDGYRRRIEGGIEGQGDHSIHFRFIGQSDGTTTVYSLLRLLLTEIKEVEQKFDEEIPLDPVKLRNEWPALLEAIGKRGPTVIVIDALNQLESGLKDVGWLPRQLPDNIKLIVSFKRGDEGAEKLYERFSQDDRVTLSEVKPFENLDDRRRLVRAYLSQYLKELDEQQLEALINLHGAGNPLYLKVVLSELRVFGAYANLTEKIGSDFGDNPVSVFVQVLKRLETDPAYSPIDPKQGVPLLFGLLAHARRGLSADEMTCLFIQSLEIDDTAQSRENAADTVSLFLRQVRSFLARREGRYDFFFESFKMAAQQCFVAEANSSQGTMSKRSSQEWHRLLANYFGSLPTWQEAVPSSPDQFARRPTRRKVAELPHHLANARQVESLANLLTDLFFLEGKSEAGMVFDLMGDFTEAVNLLPIGHSLHRVLQLLEESIRRDLHFIARHPATLFQCLWNSCWWYDCPEAAKHYDPLQGGRPREEPPWELPGSKLYNLLESWRAAKEKAMPGFVWLRSLRPPAHQLSSAFKAIFRGHKAWVLSVAFSPDGQSIVSGSRDKTVRVWDARDGVELRCLHGHAASVSSVAYSPDGRGIASGSNDRTVRVWDAATAQQLHVLHGHTDAVISVAFSPDGSRIISGGGREDQTVRIWDADTGEELRCLRGHKTEVNSVAFSPNGTCIASGAGTFGWEDCTVRIWHSESGVELSCLLHEHFVTSVAFSPDSRRIVSGSFDGAVRIWDLDSGAQLLCIRGHADWVTSVAFSPDGRCIISGSIDRTVRGWDSTTGEELFSLLEHEDNVSSLAYSPEGQRIVSGSHDKTVRVWHLGNIVKPRSIQGHTKSVESLAFSPDGQQLASGSADQTVRIWNVANGTEMRCLQGHSNWVTSVAYSPDGKRIASGSNDRTVRIWDANVGVELLCLRGHIGNSLGVAFSPDGRLIVSGGRYEDDTIHIWDTTTGLELRSLHGHEGAVRGLAFSPDGRSIAFGSDDQALRVWDAENGRELLCLWGSKSGVNAVAYSPDGIRIISSCRYEDQTTRIWDATNGDCIEIIQGRGDVSAIAAGPARFLFRAMSRELETVIESALTREIVAWFPSEFRDITTNVLGWTWAGSVADYVCLFTLEGAV